MNKMNLSITIKDASSSIDAASGDGAISVYEELLGHRTVKAISGNVHKIYPYHAISYATVTRASQEVENPVDAICGGES